MPSRVLIAVDAGDLPANAFPAMQRLAGEGAEYHVLVVVPAVEDTDPRYNWGGQDGETREEHIARMTRTHLATTPLAAAGVHILFGEAPEHVCEVAQRVGADLVIVPVLEVGAHKSRAMNPQFAEKVRATAQCRVETVNVPPDPSQAPPVAV